MRIVIRPRTVERPVPEKAPGRRTFNTTGRYDSDIFENVLISNNYRAYGRRKDPVFEIDVNTRSKKHVRCRYESDSQALPYWLFPVLACYEYTQSLPALSKKGWLKQMP